MRDLMYLGKAAAGGLLPNHNLKYLTAEAYLQVPEASLGQNCHWSDVVCSPYGTLALEPGMQALAPKLTEAFQGSGVSVEVTHIQIKEGQFGVYL